MDAPVPDKLQKLAQTASLLGKSTVIQQVQQMLMPHILAIFSEHDHGELEKMIQTNYRLVDNHTPPGIKNALQNLGSNPELREQWEGVVLTYVTPENIKQWLRNPEEWLDADEAERQRAELRRCADVIEETPGGEEWLQSQVMDLYRMARIVPKNSTARAADD